MSQQITCARIALRRHGGPMQDENDCACEHCVALRELIDMVRARPTLPAPEPPPDVLDMFTRRLEVLARERSWVSNHDTRLVCEAAVGVLRAILGAALPAEHAPPDPKVAEMESVYRDYDFLRAEFDEYRRTHP